MTVFTLLILYFCATAIAAPPTLPILPLQNDATPASVLAGPTSQLNNIHSHVTNLTTGPLPPFSFTLRLNSGIGSMTFRNPHSTNFPFSLNEVFAAAAVAARSQENATLIFDPLMYQEKHATLVLLPHPTLTWQVWKEAVDVMFLYNRRYWGFTYRFRIEIGDFKTLVASGSVFTD